jgi:hypothetical protein
MAELDLQTPNLRGEETWYSYNNRYSLMVDIIFATPELVEEGSQEKKAPRRRRLPGEEGSQEKKAPRRRRLPGEEGSQERNAIRREEF